MSEFRVFLGGKPFEETANTTIREVLLENSMLEDIILEGVVFHVVDPKKTRQGRYWLKYFIYDGTSSMTVQYQSDRVGNIKKGDWIKVWGNTEANEYTDYKYVLNAQRIMECSPQNALQVDEAPEKRVELQLFSQMSNKEGMVRVDELFPFLKSIGHDSVAITDLGAIQAFPEAYAHAKANGIKFIPGMTANLVDDEVPIAYNMPEQDIFDATYVFTDVETTGFSNVDEVLIELGAAKFKFFFHCPVCDWKGSHSELEPVSNWLSTLEDGEELWENLEKKSIKEKRPVLLSSCPHCHGIEETTNKKTTKRALVSIEVGYEKSEIFKELILSPKPVPPHITKLTGITDEMLRNEGKPLKDVLTSFLDFCKDTVLVAHNARFDNDFIRAAYKSVHLEFPTMPWIDTLYLSRAINRDYLQYHNLDRLAKLYKIPIDKETRHRAFEDAENTGYAFRGMLQQIFALNCLCLNQLNDLIPDDHWRDSFPYPITLWVKNATGLKNLFQIISKSSIEFLEGEPRVTKSLINEFREGLIVGTGSHKGYVAELARNKAPIQAYQELKSGFYDVVEIQPVESLCHLWNGSSPEVNGKETIERMYKTLYALAKKLNIPIVATGHVHYLKPEENLNYNILLYNEKTMKQTEKEPEKRKGRPENPFGPVHYRSTQEMLDAFPWLPEKERYEVVVINPRKYVADLVDDDLRPVPDRLYTPEIEGADEDLRSFSLARAHEMYGNPLPPIVDARLEKEFNSIISNGFSVIYLIAQRLVKHSNDHGYLVGSRGSVGSSFVATMLGITEVNPLEPHYYCPSCHYSEWFDQSDYQSGYDLPPKACPQCQADLVGDGHDIPFETFLGFKGDKVPDIDLNFSGEFQKQAMQFVSDWFGEDHVYRAGTVGTIAEKTAQTMVNNFVNEEKLPNWNKEEIFRVAERISGTKKTTGQHAGGILVVPGYKEVFDFTPYQYPADNKDKDQKTSHYDFHAIHDYILKLDILGHDDPTVLRILGDTTGRHPKTVPPHDERVFAMLTNPEEVLGIKMDFLSKYPSGTLGVPEMGTPFTRQMILETKPKTFGELIRISGLSHGTNVWRGNAQDLINSGLATLSEAVCTRDDIMSFLIKKGIEPSVSFKIMEAVRKGKGLKEDEEQVMVEHGVPDWYIDSCKKIQYMFPRAHAAAYILSAVRIAFYKLHYPAEYYAAVFSARYAEEDLFEIIQPVEKVKLRIKQLEEEIQKIRYTDPNVAKKARTLQEALELAAEAKLRGITFGKPRIYQSHASRYTAKGNELIPPFQSIPGVGSVVAESLYEEAQKGPFYSVSDLQARTKLQTGGVEFLRSFGCLDHIELKQCVFF